ncbi:venom serine protease Bi-VSP-like isoform X1 [Lucilia cuprina]|uniref:venom serine protease Bi-VSP-like isoform X1 n=1 Tax=Lucilia cuprina TaxID=7375 RepID=UPI001F05F2E0|nr:venom serine protease Bi-VSP-like isoform X1 [Lucilia cuprina]
MKMLKLLSTNFVLLLAVNFINCHGHWNGHGMGNNRFIRGFEQNFCRTPLDQMGTCVSLKFCPEVLTLFTKLPQNSAKQYSTNLQRICGNRITPDQYPVVCCTVVSRIDNSEPATSSSTTTTTTTTTSTTEAPVETVTANKNLNTQESSCFAKDFKTGTCKPLQDCPILYEELKRDPNNEQFKTDLRNSHTSCGAQSTIICCPPEQNASTTRVANNNNTTIHQLPTEEEGCGLVNVTLPKIVGGEESQIGAWPWMALIGYDPYSVRPFRCGGTLVSARHVITAAHCIRHDLSFVRLGEFDLSIESETRHVDVNVIKHSKHPQYGKDRRSDLAILLLEHIVQFTELIAPICMPNSVQLRTRSYIDSMPYVAGWGYTMQGGSPSHVLKQTQLPIQPNDVCRRIYGNLLPSIPAEDFNDSIFCAGYTIGGTDTCQGDSGGPLMIPELYKGITRYYLIGVVSYGHGCGKVPGIYINIQKKMDWILEKIQEM